MLCQRCKKNVATVHITEIVKNEKTEHHLCDQCAKAEGLAIKAQQISIQDLLSGFLMGQKMGEGLAKMTCPDCGLTYLEFRNQGRLGCPSDYDAFEKGLVPVLEKMHGEAKHVGKVPQRAGTSEQKHRQLMELRRRLQQAIEAENYEEAARLRDIIKGKGGTNGED